MYAVPQGKYIAGEANHQCYAILQIILKISKSNLQYFSFFCRIAYLMNRPTSSSVSISNYLRVFSFIFYYFMIVTNILNIFICSINIVVNSIKTLLSIIMLFLCSINIVANSIKLLLSIIMLFLYSINILMNSIKLLISIKIGLLG